MGEEVTEKIISKRKTMREYMGTTTKTVFRKRLLC